MDLRKLIEKWTNKELQSFLQNQDLQVLHLIESDYSILAEKE
jgi:hypothetical protein